MRPLRASLVLPPLLALALIGCPTASTKPPVDAEVAPKDEWDSIPRTPEWLHATSGFSGDRKKECQEVRRWIQGEAKCTSSLCVHGRDLASEWVLRCPKLAPDGLEEVTALRDKFTASAAEQPTECGKSLEPILGGSCGKDEQCTQAAQVWATRCGRTEGTPLILRVLERTMERRISEGEFELDARSCDELRAFMLEGAACAQQFACQDMLKRVELYKTRCEGEERPTIGTAVAQLAITAGAQQTSPPILVQPTPSKITQADFPVPLADGSGGVLLVCGERPTDLAKLVASKKACEAGAIVIAKGFLRVRELEARMGSFEFPNAATFRARLPSLEALGERELRDKEEIAALEADVTKAASLAQAGSTLEAAFELFKTVMAHAGSVRRSPAFRAVLTARDEALAPALRELAKAKVAVSSRGRLGTNEFVVFVNRAVTRPFGDFSTEFSVQPGFASRGLTLETATFMPKATEAYLDALKGVVREAARKKLDAKLLHDTTVQGYEDAKACGAAEKTYRDTEAALIRCVFGVDTCDAAKIEGLSKASDVARAAAEDAYLKLHLGTSGPAASAKGEIEQAMLARECEAPSWW